jgi:uncharacterized protein YndB with AHSA1/START domain
MKTEPLVIERTYDAPATKVWKAITDKNEMKKWYFDLEDFKAEPGFEFKFLAGEGDKKFMHLCVVKDVIIEKKLSYTWRYENYQGDTLVTWELFAEGNKTKLRLTHEGLESFAVNHNPDFDKKNFVAGWTYFFDTALKAYLEKVEA